MTLSPPPHLTAGRSPRRPVAIALAVGAATAALFACQGDEPELSDASRPNVLLISVDTLRPDHLGAYGYEKNTSPRIDQLAAEGALFENAVSSSSWTLPAHAALFTGLSDSVHGCYDSDRRLEDSRVTLAESFGDLGYRTAGFFAGPFLHPTFGLAQGFEHYVDCSSYAEQSKAVALHDGTLDTAGIVEASHRDITNPRVYEQVSLWLANNFRDEPDNGQAPKQSDPFFMFVHLWDVHFDFVPPPPYDTMFDPDYAGDLTGENFFRSPRINPQMSGADLRHILALYDGEIAWTDHHIGKILDDLDARGLLANTIVALVSDHGEEFFEHGKKGHRFTLYDEVIRIPMILWYPEKIRSGVRIQSPSSLIDIFPTLLELAGAPKADKVMGRSLLPAINGGSAFEDRLAISELNTLGRNLATFRGEATKLLLNNDNGHAWTFDLRLDRNESLGQRVGRQLAKWEVPLIEQSTQLKLWLDESKTQWPIATTAPQLSEELAEQLKVLGYLDDDEPKSSGTAAEPKGQP